MVGRGREYSRVGLLCAGVSFATALHETTENVGDYGIVGESV